jgi:hypothetical protein
MLILNPTSGEKTITIAPRTLFTNSFKGRVLANNGIYEESTCLILFQSRGYSVNLRRDGDGREETIINLSVIGISNFTNVMFIPTILEEDSTYYIEITKDDKLWYRDKVYVTSQTPLERTTEKHVIGNNTIYQTYDSTDDNTYII